MKPQSNTYAWQPPRGIRAPIHRAMLQGYLWLFAGAFAGRAWSTRGRATHTPGVGATGTLRIVEDLSLPECDFFKPGRVLAVRARHATALRRDEVERDFRSLALSIEDEQSTRLDLVMNTGHVQGFWHAANFLRGVLGGALGERGRRWYIRTQPPAFENVLAGIRRAPSSFAHMSYYAAITFVHSDADKTRRLVRFRVIPHDRAQRDSGYSQGEDLSRPWFEERIPDEDRGPGWLRAEYAARLQANESIAYWLQVQVRPYTEEAVAYHIGMAWDEAQFAWQDVGELTLETLMSPTNTEALQFNIAHQPSCLSIPEATSPWDPRSIAWLRTRIYPLMQRWRFMLGGRSHHPRWDPAHAHEHHAWRRPHSFTALLPISHDVEGLRQSLTEVGDHIGHTPHAPFERVRTLHFFRALIVDGSRLAMDWVYDGPLDAHLDEFLLHLGPWLEGLLAKHCEVSGSLKEALYQARLRAQVSHIGDVRASAADVRAEAHLRQTVEDLIDDWQARGDLSHMSPEAIRCQIREHVLSQGDDRLPSGPRPGVSRRGFVRQWLDAGRAILSPWTGILRDDIRAWMLPPQSGLFRKLGAYTLLGVHWLWTHLPSRWMLRQAEAMERLEAPRHPIAHDLTDLDAVLEREEHQIQNPLALVCPITDHPRRRWLMHRILVGAEDVSRHLWNTGSLAGIFTIHTARIFQIDEGETFLFFSDYDGSWTRYLHDFLTVGASGVVPIFAHLDGYPLTQGLFGTPPGFANAFLEATRARQVPVQLWFSAWPELSLHNRQLNAALRKGLFAVTMTDEQAEQWLRQVRL